MTTSESGYAAPQAHDLRALRETVGVSLRELARRSGYSASYLSRVETGKRLATGDVIRLYTSLPATPFPKTSVDSNQRIANTLSHRRVPHGRMDLGIVWFGSALRRRRVAQGKSLEALGAEVYLSRAYLGKIERGDARGSYQQALALDTALQADGSLARLFLEECARVGPTAPDTRILTRDEPRPRTTGPDPEELAATAATRLETLRICSHEAGPHAVLQELGGHIVELYNQAVACPTAAARPIWLAAMRYAELLGWTAQETGHDDIALRWTRAAAGWAQAIGDDEAFSYTLTRQSQWARGRGDADAAIAYARKAGSTPRISSRVAQFAAQREAQGCALAGDETGYRRALDRFRELVSSASFPGAEDSSTSLWGPTPDPAFEGSRLFEATCLVDLGDYATAASLFAQHMDRLRSGRTGYARIAVRQAIAYAHVGEAEQACEIAFQALPVVARQGSASLRSDLNRLTRTLTRHRNRPGIRDILPDLAMLARAAGTRAPTRTTARHEPVPSSATQE